MASGPVNIPAVLERSSFEHHFREYAREFQPVGHAEVMVVRDLARQTAAMEAWGEGIAALQRERAQRLPEIVLPEGEDEGEMEDIRLATAVSATEVQLSDYHQQRHTRAFYRALRTLLDLQAHRKSCEAGGGSTAPPNHFLTEAACEAHLRERLERGCHRCPQCGCDRGHFLATRRSWECSRCKRQTGIRAGTVAADSPLPLVTWFTAIRLLLFQPAMSTAELGLTLSITRSATVRSVARRIIDAMAQRNASQLLAGLDQYYSQSHPVTPESGVRDDKKPTLQSTGCDLSPRPTANHSDVVSYGENLGSVNRGSAT